MKETTLLPTRIERRGHVYQDRNQKIDRVAPFLTDSAKNTMSRIMVSGRRLWLFKMATFC